MLRDVEGWEPEEVSAALELTPGNQRVLLHRARAKVRNELEHYLDGSRHEGAIIPGGISCRELVELVTAYLDGALAPPRAGGWRRI